MEKRTRVKFIGDPDVLRNPVPHGTKGIYNGAVGSDGNFHWVHFDGTDEAQTVFMHEIEEIENDCNSSQDAGGQHGM